MAKKKKEEIQDLNYELEEVKPWFKSVTCEELY